VCFLKWNVLNDPDPGENVKLRAPRDGDAEARFKLGNDWRFSKYSASATVTSPTSPETQLRNGCRELRSILMPGSLRRGARSSVKFGLTGWTYGIAEQSMAIAIFDRNSVGRVLGSEAISLVLGHAFDTLRLHRIGIRVLSYNHRAIRAYEKCGFVLEARSERPPS
jgi:RimJ/RimL family protein N-acetyltransferase